jgi:UDP-3-O-[3-hydroxymyristoyl] glucosamine N-acyltransferase
MGSPVITLGEIAALVNGKLTGSPVLPISGAATLAEVSTGQITLVDHQHRLKELSDTPAAAVVLAEGLAHVSIPSITVSNVHEAFSRIVSHFRPQHQNRRIGISPQANIGDTAELARDVDVHPGATVAENVRVGAGSTIMSGARILSGCVLGCDVTVGPGAVLYENTIVGDRVVFHAGAVIGSFGFGFHTVEGRHQRAPQLGHVEIGADVEIGANTTIDRGTYGATIIGEGTKIDNLVQIAHNCRIGKHNLICAQVGIAGSTTTGDYVVMGGQAGVRDHIHIGNRAMLSAMAGVSNDVPEGAVMLGIPATPQREQKLRLAALAKLPEMRKEFKALMSRIEQLERSLRYRDSDRAA